MDESILKAQEKAVMHRPSTRVGGVLVATGAGLLALTLSGVAMLPLILPFAILSGLGTVLMLPAYHSEPDALRKGRWAAGPGAMLLTIGALVFTVTLLNRPEMMAYAWTLIPLGFTMGLMYGQRHDAGHPIHNSGAKVIRIFGWMFVGFALFFELLIFELLGAWWPLLLIGAGIYMINRRRKAKQADTYTEV